MCFPVFDPNSKFLYQGTEMQYIYYIFGRPICLVAQPAQPACRSWEFCKTQMYSNSLPALPMTESQKTSQKL